MDKLERLSEILYGLAMFMVGVIVANMMHISSTIDAINVDYQKSKALFEKYERIDSINHANRIIR